MGRDAHLRLGYSLRHPPTFSFIARDRLLKQKIFAKYNALISCVDESQHADILNHVEKARARREHVSDQENSPLDGQFVAIKDNICTKSFSTTCASSILQGFKSPLDSQTVDRLAKFAGTLVIGKSNMDEFGMGSHSTHSFVGPVLNPLSLKGPQISAGGSSGGSAIAVLTKQCHVSIGTDTGGSVRLPAAYTGLVGFKPSYGMLSRFGVIPYANSLDTVGIIARNCQDVFFAYRILNVPDRRDPTCLTKLARQRVDIVKSHRTQGSGETRMRLVRLHSPKRVRLSPRAPQKRQRRYPLIEQEKVRLLRIGVPVEYNIKEMSPSVRKAWARILSLLQSQGHEIIPISLPATRHALSAYYVLAPAEASSNLAKYDGVRYGQRLETVADNSHGQLYAQLRGHGFGSEVKRRILLGAYSLSADAMDNYFIQAQKVRRMVQHDFDSVFKLKNPLHNDVKPSVDGVDLIVCPTAPTTPPELSSLESMGPVDAYMNDVFTVPASLAGLPAISIPAPKGPEEIEGIKNEMIGMQIIGQYGDDYSVIQFAKKHLDWTQDWEASNVARVGGRKTYR